MFKLELSDGGSFFFDPMHLVSVREIREEDGPNNMIELSFANGAKVEAFMPERNREAFCTRIAQYKLNDEGGHVENCRQEYQFAEDDTDDDIEF